MKTPVLYLLVAAAFASPQRDLNQIIRQVFTSTTPESVFGADNFFNNLEMVPTSTPGSFGAITRCGEGEDAGRRACVRYHSCDRNGRLINLDAATAPTDKSPTDAIKNLIDLRIGGETRSSCSHTHYLDVCCDVSGNTTGVNNSTQSSTPSSAASSTSSSDLLGGRGLRRTTTSTTTPRPPSFAGCGIRNENGIDFTIIGNPDESQYGEFPWMVALISKKQQTGRGQKFAVCGGSLIRNNVVMTAAHCVNRINAEDLKIRAGEWDSETERERIPYQERDVNTIVIHEDYVDGVAYNDIALLFLEEPVRATESIGLICLPTTNQIINSNRCFASGWGKDAFGDEGQYRNILKKVLLPIVDHDDCERMLRRTRLGFGFKLHDSFLCAGGKRGQDTCSGDGGSPLVCPNPQRPETYLQVGIVSWGVGCGESGVPAAYVDVAKMRGWIDEKLRNFN